MRRGDISSDIKERGEQDARSLTRKGKECQLPGVPRGSLAHSRRERTIGSSTPHCPGGGLPQRFARARLVVAGGRASEGAPSRGSLPKTSRRASSGRPSRVLPATRRGTASPPPTRPGDHGGSLGKGKC